jgi:Tfp pilus assembly protein FimV
MSRRSTEDRETAMTATQTPASPSTAPQFRLPAPQSSTASALRADAATRPAPRSSRTYLRRRLALLAGVLLLAIVLVLTTDAISAEAGDGAPVTAGHVVVQPGQRLWDIAQANAPGGMDVRAYLLELEQLNGTQSDGIDAWDVLLLPVL